MGRKGKKPWERFLVALQETSPPIPKCLNNRKSPLNVGNTPPPTSWGKKLVPALAAEVPLMPLTPKAASNCACAWAVLAIRQSTLRKKTIKTGFLKLSSPIGLHYDQMWMHSAIVGTKFIH